MTRILQINSSLNSTNGQSSRLASSLVDALRSARPAAELRVRDLAQVPVPHLDAATFAAFGTPAAQRTAVQHAAVTLSDALIAELREADVIVLGLPMYNFGVPSTLMAWFDHVARAGVTFRYTATGPQGLLGGKKVYVLAARGGAYAGTPGDTQTAYVRDFLAFLGLTDVEFIYAEGLALGEVPRRQGLAAAQSRIAQAVALPLAA